MKVYYINSGNNGCYNVRCLLPLVANGWDGDRTSLYPAVKTPEDKARAAKDADVVVFHRPETNNKIELALYLKKLGKKIVFDNDDTYKDHTAVKLNDYFDKERTERGLAMVNKAADAFAVEADLVTCTTDWLADEYRKLNSKVVVLPNCVDPFYFEEPLKNETDVVRIGVTGSIGSSTDLDVVAPIIKHYEHDPRVKIVFFSLPPNRKENPVVEKIYRDEYAFLDSVDVEWHPTVNADVYYDKLNSLRLDMMIIPRADNYFNRAKSNLKWLEASMFEIPCIVQGFADGKSPYQVNPNDAPYYKLVMDNKDWIPEIEKMINDKEGRIALGKAAREYVAREYNIEKHAHKWIEAYESMYDSSLEANG
jgi:glycosyltransferase involved in cell wall biosynthesis